MMFIRRLPLLFLSLFIFAFPMTQAYDMGKVDINTAEVWTLARHLDGVGPKKARAIVAYREKNGPFEFIYDLDKVYGIGPKTIEKNQDKIILSFPEVQPLEQSLIKPLEESLIKDSSKAAQ